MDCEKDNCSQYRETKMCIEGIKKDIDGDDGLKKTNQKQWDHIGQRLKTKTSLILFGILVTVLLAAFSANYAISADKINDVKEQQETFEKRQEKQMDQINKKMGEIRESIYNSNVATLEKIQELMKPR